LSCKILTKTGLDKKYSTNDPILAIKDLKSLNDLNPYIYRHQAQFDRYQEQGHSWHIT